MPHAFDPEPWYKEERDGMLLDYLQNHDGTSATALFKGPEWYLTLWDQEYFTPGSSIIRLMHGCIEDEHYIVLDRNRLVRITGGTHQGKSGTHTLKQIIKRNSLWEAQHLNFEKLFGTE